MVFGAGFKFQLRDVDESSQKEVKPLENFTDKEKKKDIKYFYQISNHHELYKTGSSFFSDYKKGIKSFAISSPDDKEAQQRVILGLASYFNHEDDLSIAIISDRLECNLFKELYDESEFYEAEVEGCSKKLVLSRYENSFDLYNFGNILKFVGRDKVTLEYEMVLCAIMDNYDVIFWDVPLIESIKSAINIYQSLISKFDSLSIVVNASGSKVGEVKKVKDFFRDYGINLKGVIMDNVKV